MMPTLRVPRFVLQKIFGLFMVGACMAAVPLVIAFAFPSALGQVIGLLLLGALVSIPGMIAIHVAYGIPETPFGLAVATGLIVAVLGGLIALSNWMYYREMRSIWEARAKLEAKQEARSAAVKYIVLNHADGVKKAIPLQATAEPYISMLGCVNPLLTELGQGFQSEKRWPQPGGKVDALAQNAACRISQSALGVDGEVRVSVLDPDPPVDVRPKLQNSGIGEPLPTQFHKRGKKPEAPAAKMIHLTFYPHVHEDGSVLWLCAAEGEFEIFIKLHGCRGFKPGSAYRPDRR
ncbi:MAG: hypothetical protein JNM79_16490 [Burkholderiales bacterium]|nr:hypothetical protein [Burkholderiales bacterium]